MKSLFFVLAVVGCTTRTYHADSNPKDSGSGIPSTDPVVSALVKEFSALFDDKTQFVPARLYSVWSCEEHTAMGNKTSFKKWSINFGASQESTSKLQVMVQENGGEEVAKKLNLIPGKRELRGSVFATDVNYLCLHQTDAKFLCEGVIAKDGLNSSQYQADQATVAAVSQPAMIAYSYAVCRSGSGNAQ